MLYLGRFLQTPDRLLDPAILADEASFEVALHSALQSDDGFVILGLPELYPQQPGHYLRVIDELCEGLTLID